MSHIFDALQRSEAERSGVDTPVLSEAIEMLKRAERRTATTWAASALALSDNSDTTNTNVYSDTPHGFLKESSDQMITVASTVPDPLRSRECLTPFEEFRSLQISLSPQSRLVSILEPESPAAEAFRLLGVRLRHLRRDRTLSKLLITSTIPQEGKSMVSGNVSCTLALRTQQKVLMLEGDLRRPTLSKMFGLGNNSGLCEWLAGERSLVESIYHLKNPGLWILPAGTAPSNALELLQSGKLSALMEQLTCWFDWIVIDSPPVLPLADTSVWMRLADGVLLTTRQGITEKQKLQKGVEAIESTKLIGALVNSSNNAASSDYYYGSPTTRSKG
jgi:capsular exopolysaccharide synthesis family protein